MIKEKTYKIRERRNVYGAYEDNIITFKGTNIYCRVIGKGPSLVVLHGKFQSTYDYERLCHKLAHWFTVYGINHRSNGSNGVQGWITVCKKT